jgi:hypothetical protein
MLQEQLMLHVWLLMGRKCSTVLFDVEQGGGQSISSGHHHGLGPETSHNEYIHIYLYFDSSRKKLWTLTKGGRGGSDGVWQGATFFSTFFLEHFLVALPARADVKCSEELAGSIIGCSAYV